MKYSLIALLLCLSFLNTVSAQEAFLDSEVLGPFPAIGSPAEKLDIEQLLYFQKIRTKAQCDAAQLEANNAGLDSFFGGKHALLSAAELSRVKSKLNWLKVKTGAKILWAKTKFNRERPYITHPEVKPCIDLEKSKSYPSGHTTLARMYARVLGVIFPERAALFLQRANEVAMNRVIGGVHHPSDIEAGKIFGDAIAKDYLEDSNLFYAIKSIAN